MTRMIYLVLALGVLTVPAEASGATGSIQGTVTPLQWAPEVEVCVIESQPSERCTSPAADGSYGLSGLPVSTYRVEFIPSFRSRLVPQYYDHATTAGGAKFISVPAEGVAGGVDGDLNEGGVIEGEVTSTGEVMPLAEVVVCAQSISVAAIKSCSQTDTSGTYELHSLSGGTYRIGFWGAGASAAYQPQYYAGKSTPQEATAVSVAEGATKAGIDVALVKGGAIEGTIRAAADGAFLPGRSVCLFTAGASSASRCTFSDDSGGYSFLGLKTGSYQVGFSLQPGEIAADVGTTGEEDEYESQFFDRVAARAEARSISVLAPMATGGVDAALVGPAPPSPVPAPIAVMSPIVAVPVVHVNEPRPKKTACKKGLRKEKVKGKVRCVKPKRHTAKKHHKSGNKHARR